MYKLKTDMDIGSNLRKLRNKNEYTQERIVAKLNILGIYISRSTYSRYETGELNIPVSVLVALQKIYNCTYEDFFEGMKL